VERIDDIRVHAQRSLIPAMPPLATSMEPEAAGKAATRIPSATEGPRVTVPTLHFPRRESEAEGQPPLEATAADFKGSKRYPPSPVRVWSPALRENPCLEESYQPSSPTGHILGTILFSVA